MAKLGTKHVIIVVLGTILAAYILSFLGYLQGVKKPYREQSCGCGASASTDAVYMAPADPIYDAGVVESYDVDSYDAGVENYDAGVESYDAGVENYDAGVESYSDDLTDKIW